MNNKLLEIQERLKAPKNQRNDFGKYNYRSCEDIFEAVKPLLKELGLTLRMNDELVQVGDRYYIKATAILSDGNTTIENTAFAREEETKKGMDGSQITGASSSYARKYALNGLFLIDDVKDSDSTNVGNISTPEQAGKYKITFGKYNGKTLSEIVNEDPKYLSWLLYNSKDEIVRECITILTGEKILTEDEQQQVFDAMGKVDKLLNATKTDRDKFYKHYGVTSNGEMTQEQLEDAIKKLEEKYNKEVLC